MIKQMLGRRFAQETLSGANVVSHSGWVVLTDNIVTLITLVMVSVESARRILLNKISGAGYILASLKSKRQTTQSTI